MHAEFSYLFNVRFQILLILCAEVLVQADNDKIFLKTSADIHGGCSIPIGQPVLKPSHADIGRKGITGETGDSGSFVQGPVGLNGRNTTSCKFSKKTVSNGHGKNPDNPYLFACESWFSASAKRESGRVWVGSKAYSFEVVCNKTTKETCIDLTYPLDFKEHKAEPFWLSEVGINLRKIDTLTTLQIKWIQKRTNTARQIIKYHCKQSIPVSKTDHNHSIQLLSWNDKLIGPIITSTSPVTYTVINDVCSTKPKATSEIQINTSSIRLPIIDIRINDIRSETQKVAIENSLLCYL